MYLHSDLTLMNYMNSLHLSLFVKWGNDTRMEKQLK